MDPNLFLIYLTTTIIVVFSPGPTAIMVASQGASQGAGKACFGIFGATCATAVYCILSATGIASLIAASHALFEIIKWAGVLFLVYLGLNAIFSQSGGLMIKTDSTDRPLKYLFGNGFLIEFSNPKALIYFSALLPQFIDLNRPIATQFFIMWATAFVFQWIIYFGYAYLGDKIVRQGVRPMVVNALNKLAGGALLFAAFKMASVTTNR